MSATKQKRGLPEKNNEKADLKAAQVELVKLQAPPQFNASTATRDWEAPCRLKRDAYCGSDDRQ